MPEILLGALALIAVLFFGQILAGAELKKLVKGLRMFGGGMLALAALGAFAFDRVGVGVLLASIGWGLFTGGQMLPPPWRTRRGTAQGGARVRAARTSSLEVELDQTTGQVRGRVLSGRFAGQPLEALSQRDLIALYQEIDAQSAALLATFLDYHVGPGWRRGTAGSRTAGAAMSHAEAYAILGLQAGASERAIRSAHRKLMLQNHPDRGGSNYLAAKINQAKDVLLG